MRKLFYTILAAGLLISSGLLAQKNVLPLDQKLRMAELIVADYYVDTVNENKLVETAIRSMLEEL